MVQRKFNRSRKLQITTGCQKISVLIVVFACILLNLEKENFCAISEKKREIISFLLKPHYDRFISEASWNSEITLKELEEPSLKEMLKACKASSICARRLRDRSPIKFLHSMNSTAVLPANAQEPAIE